MVVLAKDEEEGVHEFYEFGEVVPPEDADDLQAKGLWFFSSAFSGMSPGTCYTHVHSTQKAGEPRWLPVPSGV